MTGDLNITAQMNGGPMNKVRDPGRRFLVSVFGDISHDGAWPARDRMAPIAIFGDIDLDFRHATTPAGRIAISAVAPFGNIEVLVPDGIHVDVGGFTLFGSKRVLMANGSPNDSAPPVRVRGFTVFGSLKVRDS